MRRALLLGCVVVTALCACSAEKDKQTRGTDPPRALRVATVEMRPFVRAITASGTLRPREEAAVGAEFAGYRVLAVLADIGDHVRRGEVLVRLDPALLQAQIAQQRAYLDQQIIRQRQTADEARRVSGLEGTGVLADEEIVRRTSEAGNAAAAARAAQAQLDDTLMRRERLTIRAPIDGVMLSRNVRPGDVTGMGTTPFFTIARDGLLELQAEVEEGALGILKPGTPVRVRLADGTEVEGSVRLVAPEVSPETRLGLAYVRLPVHPNIRAGGFATAAFTMSATPIRAVPEAAIVFSGAGPQLTLVGSDDRVRQIPVRTGARGGGYVELLEGPPVGARVALGASSFVVEGERIRPVRKP